MGLIIVIVSILLQFAAGVIALLLIKRTGRIRAWLFIAAALLLMGLRRSIVLAEAMASSSFRINVTVESVALLISVLMLVGVVMLGRVFDESSRTRRRLEDEIDRRQKAEADLTESLREMELTSLQLQHTVERLRFLGDHLPEGMVYQIDSGVDGSDRRYIYVSAGVETLHQFTAEALMADASLIYHQVHPDDRLLITEREQQAVRSMSPFHAEVRMVLPNGEVRQRFFTSAPRRLANQHLIWDGLEIDTTERHRAEEERQRMASLEKLGTVAGGIAHEFNNVLAGVYGNIELARMELSPGHPADAALHRSLDSMETARGLTSRLLTFAKGGFPMMHSLDLRHHIRQSVGKGLAGSPVEAVFHIADDLWMVKADTDQIDLVISNLSSNAREAMPSGGRFHVTAENAPGVPMENNTPAVNYVRLVFRDEGPGIPAQFLNRIYDPYFTTKQVGRGLGLSIVHSIVQKHHGHIRIESEPGHGTTATILLPADGSKPADDNAPVQHPAPGFRSANHVLLMDDEAVVRETVSLMLENAGYRVDSVADGQAAIERFATAHHAGDPFDITILDLTVPGGLGGREALTGIKAITPDALVIVATGYSSDPILTDVADHGFCGGIAKPYRWRELETVITRCLEKRR